MLKQSLTELKVFSIVLISKALEISLENAVKIMKKPTVKIGGKRVTMATITPNPPTVDLIIFSPLKIEDKASPKELPMIGIKLLDKNFAVLIPIVSVLDAIVVCIVKMPTNIVTKRDRVKIMVFLTADVNPEMLKFSLMLPLKQSAKKEPVIGSNKSAVIAEIIWATKKIVELYVIELIAPLEIAIIPVKTGMKHNIKSPKFFITEEMLVTQSIIGAAIIPHEQIAVKIPNELFKSDPKLYDLKLLNKAKSKIIMRQLMKSLIGDLSKFVDFKNMYSNIFVILKFWISSGFFKSTPISSKSFLVSLGTASSIWSISIFSYCSFNRSS